MSQEKDRETLLDLFSTRNRGTSGSSVGLIDAPEGQAGVPSNVAPRSEVSQRRATARAGSAGGTRSSTLSPIANSILRESRKELGSEEGFDSEEEISEEAIARAVDKVCSTRGYAIDDIVRADIIVALKKDLLGWGVIQPLIDNAEVTDIHCYDYQTVVLQRGKISETTGLRWASHEAYSTFIDRVLFRLGRSLSTQQHTIDASFPDGKRLCAV
ncbi:MAG: hypothetical protein IT290_11105, partial [Deltaproteobacteria bacterium]|nr:hypothetical protein [Deltaproteobacteria bacterium]